MIDFGVHSGSFDEVEAPDITSSCHEFEELSKIKEEGLQCSDCGTDVSEQPGSAGYTLQKEITETETALLAVGNNRNVSPGA